MSLFGKYLKHKREEEAEEFITDSLCQLFPFKEIQLEKYKDKLNFYFLSQNEFINWDYHLINTFKDYWDWEVLDANKRVNEVITLGLHFPEKVQLKPCNCQYQMELCDESCITFSKSYFTDLSLQNAEPRYYAALSHAIGLKIITSKHIRDYFDLNDVRFIIEVFDMFDGVYNFCED